MIVPISDHVIKFGHPYSEADVTAIPEQMFERTRHRGEEL